MTNTQNSTKRSFRNIPIWFLLFFCVPLLSGCATYMAASAGNRVDKWKTTIKQIPLDEVGQLKKGSHLLITMKNGEEYLGELKKVVAGSELNVVELKVNGEYSNMHLKWDEIHIVRMLEQSHKGRLIGALLGFPLDLVGMYFALKALLFILIMSFLVFD